MKRILIIEDEETLQKALAQYLTEEKFEVLSKAMTHANNATFASALGGLFVRFDHEP